MIRAAGEGLLSEEEQGLLYRPRSEALEDIAWTKADAALVDEARVLLGPRRRPRPVGRPSDVLEGLDLDAYQGDVRAAALREAARQVTATVMELDEAEFVTYGHIVVDESQDLSPMELRVLRRRDLNGSMTVVGDMGQATTASSAASWDTVLEVISPRRAPTRVDLTVSYRTPEEVLDFAAPTLAAAATGLTPPRPVRRTGHDPVVEVVDPEDFAARLVEAVRRECSAVDPGRVAVIVAEDGSPSWSGCCGAREWTPWTPWSTSRADSARTSSSWPRRVPTGSSSTRWWWSTPPRSPGASPSTAGPPRADCAPSTSR